MKFESLQINKKIQDAIKAMGYEKCTPVQEQALPESLQGIDLIAQSQTGTGKTAVFLITILQRLLIEEDAGGATKALIIVPTRELAVQVQQQAISLCKFLPYGSASIYGGVGYEEQEKNIKDGTEIIVATPGRLIDFIKSGKLNLKDIKFFVIDEADRMFDMGFLPDVKFILEKSPPKSNRHTMIFSATLDSRVRRLAERFMREPVEIEIEPDQITVDKVAQKLYHVSREEKLPLLITLLKKEEMPKVIIFTNMKRTAERLGFKLQGNGLNADVITGDVDQKKRLRLIDNLKSGKTNILVATDVAARGIHVDGITHVINYDVPNAAANYVHRIGRTARAGANGIAYTIACEEFVEHLSEIEVYIEQKIEVAYIDFELLADDSDHYRPKVKPRSPRDTRPTRRDARSSNQPTRGRSSRPDSARRPALERPSKEGKADIIKRGGVLKKGMTQEERIAHYKAKYGKKSD